MGTVLRVWGPRATAVAVAVALTVASAPASPAETGDGRLVYAALGDSFTSGPLVLPHDQSRVPQDCGQSYFNYPHVAAQRLGGASAVELRDVSCGSANIDHFAEAQDGLPAGGTNPPQYGVLGPEVDVVTVGIGGNDVGFVGLAMDCIRVLGPPFEQPCTPPGGAPVPDPMVEEIAAMGVELGEALDEIHRLAPNAEVLVVSYPTSLPHDAKACWPYVPILQADMPYLVAKFKEMNAELARQAELHDATYVDIYTPSIGHDACKPPAIAWVNGMVLVPPSFPAHPNQLGLAASGKVVASAIAEVLAGA